MSSFGVISLVVADVPVVLSVWMRRRQSFLGLAGVKRLTCQPSTMAPLCQLALALPSRSDKLLQGMEYCS